MNQQNLDLIVDKILSRVAELSSDEVFSKNNLYIDIYLREERTILRSYVLKDVEINIGYPEIDLEEVENALRTKSDFFRENFYFKQPSANIISIMRRHSKR